MTGPPGRVGARLGARLGAAAGSRSAWLALAALLVAVLAVGSVHASPPTRAARIAYLESVIKCPVCADVSIAASNAQQAVNLRAEVAALVRAGESNAEIESLVVRQFGSGELLRPSNPLLWAVPLVAVAVAALAVGATLVRRGGATRAGGIDEADEALVDEALARLRR